MGQHSVPSGVLILVHKPLELFPQRVDGSLSMYPFSGDFLWQNDHLYFVGHMKNDAHAWPK